MPYRIEFTGAAARALRKLNPLTQRRLAAAIDGLTIEPRPTASKRMASPEPLFRLRVGAYRVVYRIEDAVLLIEVIKLGHRRDVYRDL